MFIHLEQPICCFMETVIKSYPIQATYFLLNFVQGIQLTAFLSIFYEKLKSFLIADLKKAADFHLLVLNEVRNSP